MKRAKDQRYRWKSHNGAYDFISEIFYIKKDAMQNKVVAIEKGSSFHYLNKIEDWNVKDYFNDKADKPYGKLTYLTGQDKE